MSDTGGSCAYVLDPDAPQTWGGDEGDDCRVFEQVLDGNGVWRCPHDAGADETFCPFHRPVVEKDDEAVTEAFVSAVEAAGTGGDERTAQFLGATFGSFELPEETEAITVDTRVYLSYAEIGGDLDWSSTTVDAPLLAMTGVRVGGETDFRFTECRADTLFHHAEFGGRTDFSHAEFGGYTSFEGAAFDGRATFEDAAFERPTTFKHAVFGAGAWFSVVGFEHDTEFRYAAFGADAGFDLSTFDGDADFRHAEFDAEVAFTKVTFGDDADFRHAELADEPSFYEVAFDGDADFSGLHITAPVFEGADLTDTAFTDASLPNANFERALLSRATLFGADFRGAKLSGAVLGDVRIDADTQFLGHPSEDDGASPHAPSTMRSQPCCVYDPNYGPGGDVDMDKAKSVYRALEETAGKAARPRLQARCFVRRQDIQKQEYREVATGAEASGGERLVAGARWSRARVARATLLYGESPWRVIGWSLGTILGFAALYPVGGWIRPAGGDPLTYGQAGGEIAAFGDAVYYSTLVYTSLGFGDFQPVGFGQVLTTVEAGVGVVMLALLVFILGRRAAR